MVGQTEDRETDRKTDGEANRKREANGQTDGRQRQTEKQTEKQIENAKLMVAFPNFARATKRYQEVTKLLLSSAEHQNTNTKTSPSWTTRTFTI
jgi:hypothetical protein